MSVIKLLFTAMASASIAHAQIPSTGSGAVFPSKPIRIIVPATPGGGTDILSRLLAPKLTEYLSQSMIIENRAGASTNIGTEFTARAAPDGYTVLVATTPHAVNPSLFRKLPFDPIRDFTMISQLALTQNVVLVHPSLPVKTIKEFIALAKARPGQLTAGTSGGTSAFLAVAMLKAAANIDVLSIAYKGAGAALNDIVAGHIQFQVNTTLAALPFIQAGRLRAIATCGSKRTTTLSDVPTVAETVPKYEATIWLGLMAPKGTPKEIVDKLNSVVNQALRQPEVRQTWAKQGAVPMVMSTTEFDKYLHDDVNKWGAVIKAANIKVD